jgi:hypothetical protein
LFKEIKVIGLDQVRTHPAESSDEKYDIYFELSNVPPPDWRNILQKDSGNYWIDGRHVIAQGFSSQVDEILSEVRKEVTLTNQKYREQMQK